MSRNTAPLVCLILFSVVAGGLFAQGAAKPIITVLDFKTDGVSEKEMRSLISLLSSALFKTNKFKVIDVTQRDTLLKEVEFSASGCNDESCQLKIGKMLSAEMIVVGNIGKVGSRYLISAKMLETETADTRSVADGVYASLDGIVDDVPNIAAKLAALPQQTGLGVQPLTSLKSLEPAKPMDWKTIGMVVSLLTGLGAGGAGGYLIWDVAVNGKSSIDQARNDYEQASSADALSKWNVLTAVSEGVKNKLYWGIGLAAGGGVLTGLGIVLTIPPGTNETQRTSVSLSVYPDRHGAMFSLSLHL